ncbi:MAG: TSUP family transporter [Deltaproteobacteria bacterium]|nr:TSUP family transporter [Deltaproteobacteria bacterium]
MIFLGGFVDSIAGGGGIITLPAYLAFGIPPHMSLGTNKFSGFFGTLFASFKYVRHNAVDIRIAIIATFSSIFGSAIGSKVATHTSEELIQMVVLIITPIVLILFLLKDTLISYKKDSKLPNSKYKNAYAISIGVFIGFYDGFFGPGTGTFMAITFNLLLKLDLIIASGTARLCNLGSNLGSLIVFLVNNKVLFPLAFFTAISGILGNMLGSSIALKKGEKIIKPLITFVMILLIIEIVRKRFF